MEVYNVNLSCANSWGILNLKQWKQKGIATQKSLLDEIKWMRIRIINIHVVEVPGGHN